MSWLKVEVETPDKPEIWSMADVLGIDADTVFGKVFRVWRWFDQHTEDGNATGVTFLLVDRVAGITGFAAAMEKVGWLGKTDQGLSLPNFNRHNGQTAKNRANTAVRVAKHKAVKATGNDKVTPQPLPTALPREREEKEVKEDMSGKPDIVASEVIEYLNAKAGTKFQPVKANLQLVKARLSEGASPEDCRAVIDAKVAAWRDDAKMAQYLRPDTLFNATKFAQYAGQICRDDAGGEWWKSAGFDRDWQATNAGCTAVTAYLWRDGKLIKEPV
ncbi:conserved phage C-terminal domain-containing protein [Paraburkholderia nemoris]|uniref:conserved phage C-terminal domain-containing protein n=1 Tax=Paraburkholderia nemoris TaxID=2793076 RepID=UPI0038BDA766